jgi:UDP-N-acetylmuramyl pentapeptide synthase
MRSGAVAAGMNADCVKASEDRHELASALRQLTKPGDVLLFKGSRGMRMELILEQFLKTEE